MDNNYHTDNDVIENIDPSNVYNTAVVLINTILDIQSLNPR